MYRSEMPHLERLVGRAKVFQVKQNGENYLLTNQPLP